jgi:hypothetical protein
VVTQSQLIAKRITVSSGYQSSFGISHDSPASCIPSSGPCANLSSDLGEENTVAETKLYPYLGKQFPGQTIEFEGVAEPFSQYKLADGTSVKVKMIMVDAVRLDTHDDQGNPIYQFQFQQVIGIIAPDDLKRKPQ